MLSNADMSIPIKLIVGLGNPGNEYVKTRHNAGFWLVDEIATDLKTNFTHEKTFFGMVAKTRVANDQVFLAKPQTFMNKSGQCVGALARFYKLAPENILVLHDELDLMPGQVKVKQGGGHAGHNGLRDIESVLGSANFWRLRLGIGHPRDVAGDGRIMDVADYVLRRPQLAEQKLIDLSIENSLQILPLFIKGDTQTAMLELHSKG